MRIRKFNLIAILLILAAPILSAQTENLADRIASLPAVKDVQKLESTRFPEKYLVIFEQPIDHQDPSKGTFTQRAIVGLVHPDSATVVVTEGYGGQYAMIPSYRDEISSIFNTNNILVEHRYFLESNPYPGAAPEDVNWDYMTAPNAAADLHCIVTAFKELLKGKWISTGISKGGQNTMIYRTYYPDDVDFSVPYVGPLCRALYDGRHEPFVENYVGTPEDREAVKDFQIELLLRKDRLMPAFDSVCVAEGFTFNAPEDEIYDYCVLEFSFAFWQWGYPTEEIPGKDASDKEVFDYLMLICSPEYFVDWSPTSPFFVQAAKELGYYGYDMKPFRKYSKYFSIRNTKNYLEKLMLPQGVDFEFDDYLYTKISSFLLTTDARMLLIYGQYDPWSAVMPSDPLKDNIKFYIQPDGSHRARISTFPEETQKEIISILSQWLYE
ncbi:MAG TPA: aminopeptidase [Candidatus Coprenecus stercoravium]|uniref:Aminopeptidase n=1 Tax=Candidatus Coprenecus stercoravium TaxID=2840735 RepID=A0A9D2K8W0_9BACT|nr:aminopeptidase [Candidatus Coprenecus stercoravium]